MLTRIPTISLHLIAVSTICTAVPVAPLDPALMLRGACSAAVKNLVSGINNNIAVQKNEQSQTTVIQKLFSSNTSDSWGFQSAKSKLVTIVNQGITIRQNNQKIAPEGNAAIAGLAIVATAQMGELKLAQGLTGTPNIDNPNLSSLQTMFSGGKQNAKDAANGCTAN